MKENIAEGERKHQKWTRRMNICRNGVLIREEDEESSLHSSYVYFITAYSAL